MGDGSGGTVGSDGGGPVVLRPLPGESAVTQAKAVELEARGAELAGVMAVAAAGLVQVVAEAIATDAWRGSGIRSVEHWASLRFGLSAGRARRLAAAAVRLGDLPVCREAFAAGEISEDHVAAVVRAEVTAVHDAQAVDLARHGTVGQLQRALSALPPPAPSPDAGDQPSSSNCRERLWTGIDDDGRWMITGRGDADRGATIDRALWAARDQLFRARHHDREPDAAQLAEISGMDALEHLAKVALDAMDPATGAGGRRPSERYVVDYHLSADETGRVHLGPVVPGWLASLVSCDADVRPWVTFPDGSVNLGRRHRTVDARLRKVVEHRDGGCCIPGCDTTRWLVIHHIQHWADGGGTNSDNLVALCPAHHRLIHRGDLALAGNPDAGDLTVTRSDGRPFGPAPPRPCDVGPAVAAERAGLAPPQWTNRSGERAQWRWFTWLDHPPNSGADAN